VEQYQPNTNKRVLISAVELYNWLTADLDGIEALVSESISESVNVQQEMPQLVDANMSMISKQNTFYDQMTKGVEILYHNVYAPYTEITLWFQIFVANVRGEMGIRAAKSSQDYKNLKDVFNAEITSNGSGWAWIAAVLREREDAENALAVWLEAQRLQMEENKQNADRARARVMNAQRMEMENNKKKPEEHWRKQQLELASTKREMKANKKQWQQAFAECQKQL